MRLFRYSYFLVLLLSLFTLSTQAQNAPDNIVQINGVLMTADSLRAVANATILVKNQNRGVISSNMGVFTIVCDKGDTLQFSELGFRTKEYVIPKDIKGQYFSMIQLMVQDTFYLPETIIRALPSQKEFDYAFVHSHVPDDKYEIARRNTNKYMLRALAMTMPRDGRESQALYQSQQWHQAMYYGQQNPPMQIFSPLAWAEFFQAWKRGDFRHLNDYGEQQ